MENIFISFIVPVYNSEKYIEHTVYSILNQSYKDFEVILVNDGSSDKSGQICRTLSEKNNRVRYFEHLNQGVSVTRNLGLEKARGKYVWFVDSDDDLVQDAVKIMVEAAKEHDAEIVAAGMIFNFEQKNKTEYKSVDNTFVFNGKNELYKYYNELMSKNYIASLCNKMISRKLLMNNNITLCEELSIYEDYCCSMEAMLAASKIICIPNSVYNYRIRGNQSLSHRYKENMPEMLKILIQYCNSFVSKMEVGKSEIVGSFGNLLIYVSYLCIKNETLESDKKVSIRNIGELINNSSLQDFIELSDSKDKRFRLMKVMIKFKMKRMLYFICR